MRRGNDITMDVELKKVPEAKARIFSLTLKTGDWRLAFTEQELKVLIARALNETVYPDEFENTLVGYLITQKKVYLVFKIKQAQLHKLLHFFYECVKSLIDNHFEEMRKINNRNAMHEKVINKDDLFKQFPLRNDHLIKLITGRKVHLPYYSPHLERLKDKIRNYNFCSAIDYSGATGPVTVYTLSHKEFFALENK